MAAATQKKKMSKKKKILIIVFSIIAFVGATMSLDLVWNLSDIANALMAIPNLICMLALSGVIAKEVKRFTMTQKSLLTADSEPLLPQTRSLRMKRRAKTAFGAQNVIFIAQRTAFGLSSTMSIHTV